MRRISRPSFSTQEVLLECISNYRDKDLVSRFEKSEKEIVDWSNTLEQKIITHTVSTMEEGCLPVEISKNEMIKLYTDKLAKMSQPGRVYYDRIMNSALHQMCPLCGYRPVDSLDHYLPKEKFPALSISPINLIPACMGCNKNKFTDKPSEAEDEFIHPYFDDIEKDLWLYSEIYEEIPLTIFYKVNPHQSWDRIKKERVKKHFKRFKLGQLYSSYASEEISGKLFSFKKSFEHGGNLAVKNELLKEIESLRYVQVNSWKTALYTALYESDWFCNEALSYSIEDLLR
ncbi:HNH endonuclease [Bacillus mycoides]|uniref:HNH endonuclease n=1 Tax=Bacillus mycoides TaxID=1405 RepID=UPI0021134609|nr:hypothetical protein [Bacillus mycoides]MCQ6565082.1 hypothetical protein [Bacillus mycoides]